MDPFDGASGGNIGDEWVTQITLAMVRAAADDLQAALYIEETSANTVRT